MEAPSHKELYILGHAVPPKTELQSLQGCLDPTMTSYPKVSHDTEPYLHLGGVLRYSNNPRLGNPDIIAPLR
jgi:hypothetical protein